MMSPAWRGNVMRIPSSVGANTKVTPLRTIAPAPLRQPPDTSTAPSERMRIESPYGTAALPSGCISTGPAESGGPVASSAAGTFSPAPVVASGAGETVAGEGVEEVVGEAASVAAGVGGRRSDSGMPVFGRPGARSTQ